MHLRPAQHADEPTIARICARAFFDEDLFGRVIHPHRYDFPDDVKVFWHEWIQGDWSDARNELIVAVEHDKNHQETILGLAVWQRQGDDAGAQKIKSAWVDPGAWPALPSTKNRALDPSKKTILQESAPYTKHYWAGDNATNWYLSLCCVDPDVKGQGVGRLLVQWGLKRAQDERIKASVISSDGSDAFYIKCGFDEVIGNANEGDENPLRKENVKGGNILFMWDKSGSSNKACRP